MQLISEKKDINTILETKDKISTLTEKERSEIIYESLQFSQVVSNLLFLYSKFILIVVAFMVIV